MKPAEPSLPHSRRLLSLDAYRGIVMFVLFAAGFGLAKVADNYPSSDVMEWVKFHTTHPPWASQFRLVGFSLWDMIQPAFMFMVGVSMPYSYGNRARLGDSRSKRLWHAWKRALILVLLGVFLQSIRKPETNWIFTNVLSQIGLGYGFLFFLLGSRLRIQIAAGAGILIGYWLLMLTFPAGSDAHFENRSSFPQQIDLWLLNLFPRSTEFTGHDYATLNFVPSMVTMLMGLMCGELIRNPNLSDSSKLRRLWVAGAASLGLAILWSPLCPIIKKLWTPSWTLFSGAYVIWFLAFLYWAVDVKGYKRGWAWFFAVVGMNSIVAYMMGQLLKPWTRGLLQTHLPDGWFSGNWGPFWESTLVAMFFWLILWWMYRNRFFVRI